MFWPTDRMANPLQLVRSFGEKSKEMACSVSASWMMIAPAGLWLNWIDALETGTNYYQKTISSQFRCTLWIALKGGA